MLPAYGLTANMATYAEANNRALALAAGHFDSIWMIDHLHDAPESFTTLAWFAALHPSFQFGHTVLCQSYRNPALLAKMAATLQMLSDGRFTLGIGAGWHEAEYRAYDYDFPSNRVRVEQLEEALQIIKAMWSQDAATFEGRHFHINKARCDPRPDPIPKIMVGAFGPKMLRLAARHADEWNVSSTGIKRYRQLAGEFERACAEISRDPSTVARSWGGGCFCARSQEKAEKMAGDYNSDEDDPNNFDFVGTPAQIVMQMQPFIDAGVTTFMLDCADFPDLSSLQMVMDEVLPAADG
jgi:alkanesulfonate monooxygenase SsuD/methylene tetrahydromethanopterin reductase-like flavin-dependent oxidoreductase (luciferase family)